MEFQLHPPPTWQSRCEAIIVVTGFQTEPPPSTERFQLTAFSQCPLYYKRSISSRLAKISW